MGAQLWDVSSHLTSKISKSLLSTTANDFVGPISLQVRIDHSCSQLESNCKIQANTLTFDWKFTRQSMDLKPMEVSLTQISPSPLRKLVQPHKLLHLTSRLLSQLLRGGISRGMRISLPRTDMLRLSSGLLPKPIAESLSMNQENMLLH